MKELLIAGVAFAALVVGPAIAADATPPAYKAPPAAVAPGGVYVWVDGLWERVNLPDVSLGMFGSDLNGVDKGLLGNLQQRLNGGGVRGGIGYDLHGSNWRGEFGAFYRLANGSRSGAGAAAGTAPGLDIGVQLLNGSTPGVFDCRTPVRSCPTTATLSSDITTWQLNGKLIYDWRSGAVLLSPSVAVFGGQSHSHQTFSQTMNLIAGGAVSDTGNYVSSTALSWTDFGLRVGLDANVEANSWLILGAGGYVGFVGRTVALSASDVASSAPFAAFNGASAISAGATTTALVANAEVAAAVKVSPLAVVRGFVGVNYDNRVPGISSPSYTLVAGQQLNTPAGISFNRQTSYYAGAGVVVRLGQGPLYAKN